MLDRLLVIPGIVKLRIGLIIGGGLGVLALPWLLFGDTSPSLAAVVQLVILVALLYNVWCFSADLTWGIVPGLLGRLPVPPDQAVRLSFNDGPTQGMTDLILDLLRESGLRASFFVLLAKARAHPDLVRRILAEGHVLGLHDHRPPFFRSAADLQSDLTEARQELETVAGHPVELYRSGRGWKNLGLVAALRAAGLRLCFWDRGVWDCDELDPAVLHGRLRQVAREGGAPIILLHDGLADLPDVPPHAGALLSALSRWLPELRRAPEA